MRRSALVVLVVLGATACSGSDNGSGPDVAGPSPATEAAAPTAVTVASTTTTATTLPTSTAAPATTPAPTTAALAGPYQAAAAPTFPSRSSAPPTDGLLDGSYYAVARGATPGGPNPSLAVTIYQLLTGPEAIAAAQADGHGLDSDVYVPEQPAADRDIELRPELFLSVARPDRPDVSYAVDAEELIKLVNGAAPAAGAPDGYRYIPFPYLITVIGGVPTRVEQLWSP
jgi:hypothetical protein